MRSPSIDNFYNTLNKHILLAEAYTEVKGLSFIIKACRLKPYDYVFNEKSYKTILYNYWFDEYGNSLTIDKKKIIITYNDLKLDKEKIVNTDLYHGAALNKIIKISKLVYVLVGKDEDTLQDYIVLSLLGIDNYLRTYTLMYGQWIQSASLSLGMADLKNIKKYFFLKGAVPLNKENVAAPCSSPRAWIACLPADEYFLQLLSKESDIVSSILTKGNL